MSINIVNRKARYEFQVGETYTAGLQLMGSEIKSIRENNANLNEAYCYFKGNELFVKDMFIAEYEQAYKDKQHEPKRDRKLLLNRNELDKIKKKVETKGFTVVALRLFINKKGLAKLEIAVAKGKKLVDKRNTIKDRDLKRESARKIKL
jgi:SsrA-binding protein